MNRRIYLSPPHMFGNERELVDEAFASNYIAPCGPMVERFERRLAEHAGMPCACAVSSCTAALDLLFHELGVGAGDTLFCSNLTFIASIGPAVHRGALPVFIGSDAGSWTLSPALLAEALNDAGRAGTLPKAVVAVDLYGQCCDYAAIEALCDAFEVPLIVDAAEALGAGYCDEGYCDEGLAAMESVKGELLPSHSQPLLRPRSRLRRGSGAHGDRNDEGKRGREPKGSAKLLLSHSQPVSGCEKGCEKGVRPAGAAGWAGVFSFNGNKIITSSGGGALISRDAEVVRRAVKRSQQSREAAVWYEHRELGFNHRMSNIVAAIGLGQLENLDRIIEKKRAVFASYRRLLGDAETIAFMPEAEYGRCTRWLTVLRIGADKPSAAGAPSARVLRVIDALERENIEARPVWKPMHMQPVFQGCRVYGGSVDQAIFTDGLCLPSGTGVSESDIERIAGIVRQALRA